MENQNTKRVEENQYNHSLNIYSEGIKSDDSTPTTKLSLKRGLLEEWKRLQREYQ